MNLAPDETQLIGGWEVVDGRITRDPTSVRIELLISRYLERLAESEGGWSALYRDPADGRLWELTYPHSEVHGGGPPSLTCIDLEHGRAKYANVGG